MVIHIWAKDYKRIKFVAAYQLISKYRKFQSLWYCWYRSISLDVKVLI